VSAREVGSEVVRLLPPAPYPPTDTPLAWAVALRNEVSRRSDRDNSALLSWEVQAEGFERLVAEVRA